MRDSVTIEVFLSLQTLENFQDYAAQKQVIATARGMDIFKTVDDMLRTWRKKEGFE